MSFRETTGTVTTSGANTFIEFRLRKPLSMGSTASAIYEASYNTSRKSKPGVIILPVAILLMDVRQVNKCYSCCNVFVGYHQGIRMKFGWSNHLLVSGRITTIQVD
jgi:hypothetical protein